MSIFERFRKAHSRLATSEQFPGVIDAVSDKLRNHGFISEADRLHKLVHEMAWTTSNELYGELRLALDKIRKECHSLPPDIGSEVRRLIKSIDRICRGEPKTEVF
jgi:hypothetical protein